MTDRDRSWFGVSFDAGRRALDAGAANTDGDPHCHAAPASSAPPVDAEQAVRLREKAAVLEECAELARVYERQGADAGFVRVVLAGRASSARKLVDELCPLEEAPNIGEGASSSGPGEPSDRTLRAGRRGGDPGSGLTANTDAPSPGPLTERLALIATSLSSAIATLESREAKRLMGGAGTSIADYLRTIQALARGQRTVGPAPEPKSLRVDPPPTLRIVK